MIKNRRLEKKEELKKLALNLKFFKNEVKIAQRSGEFFVIRRAQSQRHLERIKYRSLHIFMSLARGRKREEIETNFLNQNAKSSPSITLERRIISLCSECGFEYNKDEHGRVLNIFQF